MGNDSPWPCCPDKNKPLYNYFKQLFAQGDEPADRPDPRNIVMSLNSFIGPKPNLLDINAINPPMRLEVHQPVLDFDDMAACVPSPRPTAASSSPSELDITYPAAWGGMASRPPGVAVRRGRGRHQDRPQHPHHHGPHVSSDRVAIPALLALSAVPPPPRPRGPAHHGRPGGRDRHGARSAPLRRAGRLRRRSRPPYLALENPRGHEGPAASELSAEKALYNYIKAMARGLSKIMSKMGIRTYMSYCGAQIFEAIGLEQGLRREVLPWHAHSSRRHRRLRSGRRSHPHARRRLRQRPAARHADAGGEYAWRTRGRRAHVDAWTRSPSCSTRAAASSTPTRNTPRSSTTRASAT